MEFISSGLIRFSTYIMVTIRVGFPPVHVGKFFEPGTKVMKVLELEVSIVLARVEAGQGASWVTVTLIGVVTQVIVRICFWKLLTLEYSMEKYLS